MNYFTPELHMRLQEADADRMDAADEAWESALAGYQERLKSVRAKLPPSAREFLDRGRLHDAEVLWMGQALPFFGILLRLDPPSTATVGLTYFAVREVKYKKGDIPLQFAGSPMQWMYDEVDLGEQEGCFRHSVLFSNGSELEVEAREVHLATLDTVYAQFDSLRIASPV
jgi:hypothetical protein